MPSTTNIASAEKIIKRLVEEIRDQRGFLQHSPVRTGVWELFLAKPLARVPLLLIPLRSTTAGKLCVSINGAISDLGDTPWCTYNQSIVSAQLDFETLVTRTLPLSRWWQKYIEPNIDAILELVKQKKRHPGFDAVISDLKQPRASGRDSGVSPEMLWCIRMLGIICQANNAKSKNPPWPTEQKQLDYAAGMFRAAREIYPDKLRPQLFAVSHDRGAVPCLTSSVRTIKGDASREVFDIKCNKLTWAVIDSGVDRRHPAFSGGRSGDRIVQTLDFTLLGTMLQLATSPDEGDRKTLEDEFHLTAAQVRKISRGIMSGDDVDWDIVATAITKQADDDEYFDALDPHGTQVAGILGAGEGNDKNSPPGVCPDIKIIDMRVIAQAQGDVNTEFHIMSALQYIYHLNRGKDKPVVHGVNMSLSLPHSVTDYGCGRTPICDECDRLVSSGVVVVAAAGNFGFDLLDISGPAKTGGYRDISITDPGNTDSVITVGATHGSYPHRFGVSYFSSRGPTGDGRAKPDLIAPGENINCPSRNSTYEECSGTSMSAPHVSGAAALLMARHTGLIGDPVRVKKVLCESATDLNRARESQGCGLVDVLRALQAL